jgi:hypothetical protein
MILHIDDSQTVADLQDKFADCFPGLKIEFYKMWHHHKEAAQEGRRIDGSQLLGAVRKNHEPGNFEVMSWYTTERLQREFRDRFGLYVQVFRNENGQWKQITRTSNYTLIEQMDISLHAPVSAFPGYRKKHREYEYF